MECPMAQKSESQSKPNNHASADMVAIAQAKLAALPPNPVLPRNRRIVRDDAVEREIFRVMRRTFNAREPLTDAEREELLTLGVRALQSACLDAAIRVYKTCGKTIPPELLIECSDVAASQGDPVTARRALGFVVNQFLS